MYYVLICLCLSLAGVAGLQFFYMVYLERLHNEHKKRIKTLENRLKVMTLRLEDAEESLAERDASTESLAVDSATVEEEHWADVIEER